MDNTTLEQPQTTLPPEAKAVTPTPPPPLELDATSRSTPSELPG